MANLKGKVAWVTGAGTGIGEGAAMALARDGAMVVLTGRRRRPLQAVADKIAQGRRKGLDAAGGRDEGGGGAEGRRCDPRPSTGGSTSSSTTPA